MWSTSYFGAGGTVNGFYQQASFGEFSLAPAPESGGVANNGVVGWLQLPYNHPDFGNDYDARETKLANDAVKAADPFVDYQSLRHEQERRAQPHRAARRGDRRRLRDVLRRRRGQLRPERVGSRGRPAPAGRQGRWRQGQPRRRDDVRRVDVPVGAPPGQMSTIGLQVHELGHDIGFPDLYDTDFSSSGLGDWSIMADGSYAAAPNAFPGSTPTLPDAWSKSYQGWIMPQPVVGLVNGVPVPTSATSPTAYRLRDNPHGVDWKFYEPLRQGRVLPRREQGAGRLRRRTARLRPVDLSRRRDRHEDQRRQHRRRASADRRRGGQRHQPAGRLQLPRLGVRPVPGLDRQGRLHRRHRTVRRALRRPPVRCRRARQHRLRRHDERQPLRAAGQRLVRRRDRARRHQRHGHRRQQRRHQGGGRARRRRQPGWGVRVVEVQGAGHRPAETEHERLRVQHAARCLSRCPGDRREGDRGQRRRRADRRDQCAGGQGEARSDLPDRRRRPERRLGSRSGPDRARLPLHADQRRPEETRPR